MASSSRLLLFAVQLLVLFAAVAGTRWQDFLRLPSESASEDDDAAAVGTRWAVLIAGSNGYYNYRHQADVCHAYQIMKKGGLKDENIIVFMYDDLADSPDNPRPGVIINHPDGGDVYAGVPKDYTGKDVNNFLAVLLGNKSAVTDGGSGKVVASGPDDHVFVYYSDHGRPGVLGMPSDDYLYAEDLACESGSIFEGLLPKNISVYATTAANAEESSWGTYCPGDDPGPPPEFDTCLGDLYSVAWMEDSDAHNRRAESLRQQYEIVKDRTSAHGTYSLGTYSRAEPLHRYRRAAEGTPEKAEAQRRLLQVMSRRSRVDSSMELIGGLLFGSEEGPRVLGAVRPAGQPLADDWDCLKSMARAYEHHCGPLTQYGMKHMRAFANICNAGVGEDAMAKVASQACAAVARSD
ncbi:unnamed protein product [Miscanthus lutarioriparius]|uniref:Legumain prodomain domain-containing protein n=1 Tax=Miscanthus lutarioriparius TaxID=422564 RepID=A0A811RKK1_9POAL|nr:unnamed protein product [Miscanthus lutarioriparius]